MKRDIIITSENKLEAELKKAKEELSKTSGEKEALQKAIWDMLNYTNMFVLLLDKDMNIKLINYSLAIKLGFSDEKEPLGRCWLDFIKEDERSQSSVIHHAISHEENEVEYKEVISDIVKLDGKFCRIKWFNTSLNNHTYMTFSFGILKENDNEMTEDSIRTYYKDIIEKDKTMIRSLRDSVLKGIQTVDICVPSLNDITEIDFGKSEIF